MNIIKIIDNFFPSLSKTEKKIATYVKSHYEKIGYQTLQEISQTLKVGEASILRFCRKIGLKGFNELKLNVSKEEKKEEVFQNYAQHIQSSLHTAIDNTYALQNLDLLNEAIQLIYNAKRVFLYGVGSSGISAQEAQSKFLRYGKLCYMLQDSHFQVMSSAITNDEDVIIAFSLSGYTKDVIEVLEIAKENNTKIISVTNHILSPIARLSDIVLLSYGKETPLSGGSLSAKISQLYIVDILSTGYGLIDKYHTTKMKERTSASILQKSIER